MTLLQQEIANCNEEVTKIVQEKEAQIEREQSTASYWRTQFGTLQQEHKSVISRCQNVEALLKEEQDSNEQNLKVNTYTILRYDKLVLYQIYRIFFSLSSN